MDKSRIAKDNCFDVTIPSLFEVNLPEVGIYAKRSFKTIKCNSLLFVLIAVTMFTERTKLLGVFIF